MLLCPGLIVLIIELAGCHQPQANNNNYEEFALVCATPITTATIDISEATPPNRENPYHVTADAIRNVPYSALISRS